MEISGDAPENFDLIGGVDVSVRGSDAVCAVVALEFPSLVPVECVRVEDKIKFPYAPGLLAFREGEIVLKCWENLKRKPGVVMFDGQGIAHPRKMGLAAHMGLWIETPSLGVGKTRLYGRADEPGEVKGSFAHLYDEKNPSEIIGAVLRTRTRVKPVYVSPGHMLGVGAAVDIAIKSAAKYKIPEPTRLAHIAAGGGEVMKLRQVSRRRD